jgi:hypothetical protein
MPEYVSSADDEFSVANCGDTQVTVALFAHIILHGSPVFSSQIIGTV